MIDDPVVGDALPDTEMHLLLRLETADSSALTGVIEQQQEEMLSRGAVRVDVTSIPLGFGGGIASSGDLVVLNQRGFPRPFDLPNISNVSDGSDIGAFERGPEPAPTLTPTEKPTDTAIPTDTITPGGPTMTPTEARSTHTPSGLSPTPTETPIGSGCVGDCDGDGSVSIGELIRGINIVLELLALTECPAFDADGAGSSVSAS